MLAYHLSKNKSSNQYLVLLHGYCLNKLGFEHQVQEFCKHFNILTVDLPGFGESSAIDNISIEGMADEVYKLLNYLGIKDIVLMGHSMGGYITLAFAKKYIEILKGIGLIHSTASPDTDERKEKRKQVIDFINKYGAEPYLKTFIPGLFSDITATNIKNYFTELSLSSSKDGIINAAIAMMQRENGFDILEKINLPVFFCIGEKDPLIAAKDLFYQSSTVSVAKICYLQNSAHMGFAEEPDLFNKAVIDFVAFCY